jgi:threonine dehydrogenase-like Zn-dependent dehydrogenase
MLSVHLESGRVEVRRQPLPRIPRGFARIRLLAAGICSTDLELQRGYYGFTGTPGHEFVGEVYGPFEKERRAAKKPMRKAAKAPVEAS